MPNTTTPNRSHAGVDTRGLGRARSDVAHVGQRLPLHEGRGPHRSCVHDDGGSGTDCGGAPLDRDPSRPSGHEGISGPMGAGTGPRDGERLAAERPHRVGTAAPRQLGRRDAQCGSTDLRGHPGPFLPHQRTDPWRPRSRNRDRSLRCRAHHRHHARLSR